MDDVGRAQLDAHRLPEGNMQFVGRLEAACGIVGIDIARLPPELLRRHLDRKGRLTPGRGNPGHEVHRPGGEADQDERRQNEAGMDPADPAGWARNRDDTAARLQIRVAATQDADDHHGTDDDDHQHRDRDQPPQQRHGHVALRAEGLQVIHRRVGCERRQRGGGCPAQCNRHHEGRPDPEAHACVAEIDWGMRIRPHAAPGKDLRGTSALQIFGVVPICQIAPDCLRYPGDMPACRRRASRSTGGVFAGQNAGAALTGADPALPAPPEW